MILQFQYTLDFILVFSLLNYDNVKVFINCLVSYNKILCLISSALKQQYKTYIQFIQNIMGNDLCTENIQTIHTVQSIPKQPHKQSQNFKKSQTLSNRFGDIQKIKSSTSNMYNLILPINNSSIDFVSVQCRFITNSLQQKLYDGTSLIMQSQKQAPIIDLFDTSTNKQIYHKILYKCVGGVHDSKNIMKIYPFKNYKDKQFKNGIYELYLYNTLKTIKDFYIYQRNAEKCLVMIFQSYECSLYDLLVYRQLANYRWQQPQLVYIVLDILLNYQKLSLNNISHRDIRPSTIFLKSRNSTKTDKDKFQFLNLESARKFNKQQIKSADVMLLTVRGVPFFTENKIKRLINDKLEVGIYQYEMIDRYALARVINAIVNINPYETQINIGNKSRQLNQICQKLLNKSVTYQAIMRSIKQLAKKYQKENFGLFEHDINFARILSKKLILQSQQQRIKQSYLQNLFYLHQKDIFIPKILSQINKNTNEQNEENNLILLHRLGLYYQSIGATNNDYYHEELLLTIKLAKITRIHGYYDKSDEYVEKATEIHNKLAENIKNIETSLVLEIQKAYNQYHFKKNDKNAIEIINKAMYIGGKDQSQTINIQTQLNLILCKGILQRLINHAQSGDQYFQKGLFLCAEANDFQSYSTRKLLLSEFQYEIANSLISQMNDAKMDIKIKNRRNIAKAQSYLNAAIKSKQPQESQAVQLSMCYQALGDLFSLIQKHQQAKNSYKKADIFYRTSKLQVCTCFQIKLLKKLLQKYEHQKQEQNAKLIEIRINKLSKKVELGPKKRSFGNKKKKNIKRDRNQQQHRNPQMVQQIPQENQSENQSNS